MMTSRRKKLAGFMLALVLVLGLTITGCGKSKDEGTTDPNLGVYEATSVSMAGFTMDIADVFEEGFSIELKEKGKLELNIEGDTGKGNWTLDGDKIEIKGSGVELHGTLSDGVMYLENVMDAGMDLTLENASAINKAAKTESASEDKTASEGRRNGSKKSASLPGSTKNKTEDEPQADTGLIEKTEIQKYWNGDWYGYMYIDDAEGAYESLKDLVWDACGTVELDENGDGTITLWYASDDFSNGSYDEPIAFARINVSYENGFGAFGTAMSIEGWGIADCAEGRVEEAGWVIDPDNDEYPNTMMFGDYYEDDDGYLSYEFILRPWGDLWEDIEEDELTSLMPGFHAWYLPLVEEGWAMPMGFDEDPVKRLDERTAELLAPEGTEAVSGGKNKNSAKSAGQGKKAEKDSSAGETYDHVKPNGTSYTWGNLTVCVPGGMKTTNGGIGTPDDKNSLWLQNGSKYILIQISDLEKAKSDVSTTKSINDGRDAVFTVNGVEWNAAKYEYSGSPVWQGYAEINGTVYEILSYGYDFGDEETLTVISGLK